MRSARKTVANKKSADNVALGAAMRLERREHGYSQETFARLAGFDRSEVEAIERGESNVTYLTVLKIAAGLGMSPVELVLRAGL
jgi:transcriptional regulator with XRE-family HTH domain